ncbi:NAD-dependent epimerase/dehydratase family protein [bacterium]|nr:NAD-dependent epimerase/dehydratase family protein [bacterium]
MTKKTILVTGAAGELGTALLPHLAGEGTTIVAVDKNPEYQCPIAGAQTLHLDICDHERIAALFSEHRFDVVFHFAALLSSAAEKNPFLAQQVNMQATSHLLQCAYESGRAAGRPTRFLFPSSIAAYGAVPGAALPETALCEDEHLFPSTLYGIQKLFVERLGTYLSLRKEEDGVAGLDFRSLRYPGIISIHTLPTGGTSDYAAEMLHHAKEETPYRCFVSEQSTLPFMTAPDALGALLALAEADPEALQQRVYNVRGFSVSAQVLRAQVLQHFPSAEITFEPVQWRDDVVASWPNDIDDGAAKRDFGWAPEYSLSRAFSEYFFAAQGEDTAAA